jgi:hypothetical protein
MPRTLPGSVSAAGLNLIAAEYRDGVFVDERLLPGLIAVALSYIARLSASAAALSGSPGAFTGERPSKHR